MLLLNNNPKPRLLEYNRNLIALNSLHKNFDITTISLLKIGNKTIDQIQSILQLKKIKNFFKRAIEVFEDLVIVFQDGKKKANTGNECYNCHKLGYFGQDCPLSNKKLNRIQYP